MNGYESNEISLADFFGTFLSAFMWINPSWAIPLVYNSWSLVTIKHIQTLTKFLPHLPCCREVLFHQRWSRSWNPLLPFATHGREGIHPSTTRSERQDALAAENQEICSSFLQSCSTGQGCGRTWNDFGILLEMPSWPFIPEIVSWKFGEAEARFLICRWFATKICQGL